MGDRPLEGLLDAGPAAGWHVLLQSVLVVSQPEKTYSRPSVGTAGPVPCALKGNQGSTRGVKVGSNYLNLTMAPSTKMECDYLNGWIRNSHIGKNLTQSGEPKGYSWGRRRRRTHGSCSLSLH